MLEWLAGGALGAVVASLGLGFLLWRERGKRADAELEWAEAAAELASVSLEHERLKGRESTLAKLVARKEARIRDLEAQLAAVDPGRLLDNVFGGVPETPAPEDSDD